MPRKSRSNGTITEELVREVANQLVRRVPNNIIRRYICKIMDYPAPRRTQYKVLREARELIQHEYTQGKETQLAIGVRWLENQIYDEDVDVALKLKAQTEINKMLGLHKLGPAEVTPEDKAKQVQDAIKQMAGSMQLKQEQTNDGQDDD